ncbi:hypothetical protein HYU07_05185 [Candidatus Woesearchaeota archaeon]|nr:hypothetical protein [Candidatus Woesearchaeota archaeon]
MASNILREAIGGWHIIFLLAVIVGILSLINPALGKWGGDAAVFILVLFIVLGIWVVLKDFIKKISGGKNKPNK